MEYYSKCSGFKYIYLLDTYACLYPSFFSTSISSFGVKTSFVSFASYYMLFSWFYLGRFWIKS